MISELEIIDILKENSELTTNPVNIIIHELKEDRFDVVAKAIIDKIKEKKNPFNEFTEMKIIKYNPYCDHYNSNYGQTATHFCKLHVDFQCVNCSDFKMSSRKAK